MRSETLLILHKWDETLGAYDAESGEKRGVLAKLGSVPHEMVLSRDGHWLYVSNYGVKMYTDAEPGANTVSIVDLRRGEKVGEIGLGAHHRPHGIALGRSGRLYLTTDFPPAVLVVDPRARKVVARHLLDDVQLPHMLAVRKDERTVYVANSGSASVTVLRPGAPAGTRPGRIVVGGVPMGVALSPDDSRLFVTNRNGNALVVIDTKTERVTKAVTLPGAPARVEVVPGGRQLVVTLIDAGDVALVDATTYEVVKRQHVGERAEGLFVDGHGRFACVSAQAENKVVKIALPSLEKLIEIPTGARPDPIVLVPGRMAFAAAK